MIEITDKTKCCGCKACYSACPVGSITMLKDDNGFWYPAVDKKKCIDCGNCENVCPVLVSRNNQIDKNKKLAYAARTKNEETLFMSTSGGIAYELALEILNRKGIVYGVCYDEKFRVKQCRIELKDELYRIQGSKYIQSDTDNTFNDVKQELSNGRLVFYTGTPCQIEGLLSFLGRDYDNLITQDNICHGVPSPGMWERYLKEENFENANRIIFREKSKGWGANSEFVVKFCNGNERRIPLLKCYYYYYFYWNYSLRPICFNCPFKTGHKKSDVTVADLWGIEEIIPDLINDTRGMSFVSIHSSKGEELFKSLNNIEVQSISYDKAISKNMMALTSVKKPEKYDAFWCDINRRGLAKSYNKYRKRDPLILAIKKKLYPIKKLLGD